MSAHDFKICPHIHPALLIRYAALRCISLWSISLSDDFWKCELFHFQEPIWFWCFSSFFFFLVCFPFLEPVPCPGTFACWNLSFDCSLFSCFGYMLPQCILAVILAKLVYMLSFWTFLLVRSKWPNWFMPSKDNCDSGSSGNAYLQNCDSIVWGPGHTEEWNVR